MNETKKLPLGIDDFKVVVEQCLYIDKTLLIKDMIDRVDGSVTLFTRPRRFGKSLTLSMLDYYFSFYHKDEINLFNELAISKVGKKYQIERGVYPLIHFNFKNIIGLTDSDMIDKLKQVISEEARRHSELITSNKLNSFDLDELNRLINKASDRIELSSAARILCELLYKHYEKKVVILIDEYDSQIERARAHNFYDEAITFFRSFYGEVLKSNPCLKFAALTGVLQISKESLFSDLNNLVVDSVIAGNYSEYFGFSEIETKMMLDYYGYSNNMDEAKKWYDGYRFGNEKIYNPWSIINYIFYGGHPDTYWVDTGENSLFRGLIFPNNEAHNQTLIALLSHETLKVKVDNSLTYLDLANNENAFFSFLLATGYLAWVEKDELTGERSVKIPNFETARLFQNEVLARYSAYVNNNWSIRLKEAFEKQDTKLIGEILSKYVISSFSSYDFNLEKNYQCLLLGVASVLFQYAAINSVVNAGEGRLDIQIVPFDKNGAAYIIEIKSNKSKQSSTTLEKMAEVALKQIIKKDYKSRLVRVGYQRIVGFGMAFSKQSVKITSQELL